MENKLSYEDFFKMAILRLRNPSKSRGIHSVFSGFNEAFRKYFNEDPIKVTQELASKGIIEIRYAKKGVMIYLPGEAPKSRDEIGVKALGTILGETGTSDHGLVQKVIEVIERVGRKSFPEDFILESKNEDMYEIEVPGTPLQIDPNSPTLIVSPKGHFRYEARNPSEAKYIYYAHKIGKLKVKIPRDNRLVFKAVAEYKKYCQAIREQAFASFLKQTNDEEMAELLTKEVEQKLDLRAERER